jgi:hypothetical protein
MALQHFAASPACHGFCSLSLSLERIAGRFAPLEPRSPSQEEAGCSSEPVLARRQNGQHAEPFECPMFRN